MSLSLCPRWRNKMYLFIYLFILEDIPTEVWMHYMNNPNCTRLCTSTCYSWCLVCPSALVLASLMVYRAGRMPKRYFLTVLCRIKVAPGKTTAILRFWNIISYFAFTQVTTHSKVTSHLPVTSENSLMGHISFTGDKWQLTRGSHLIYRWQVTTHSWVTSHLPVTTAHPEPKKIMNWLPYETPTLLKVKR